MGSTRQPKRMRVALTEQRAWQIAVAVSAPLEGRDGAGDCDVKKPFPYVGEVVAFREEPGPKGPVAKVVVRANAAAPTAPTQEEGSSSKTAKPVRHDRKQGNGPQPTTLIQGVVQYYNATDGSGFLSSVTGSGGGRNVAFHITNCDVQTPAPRIGERIVFSRSEGPNPVATTVMRHELTGTAIEVDGTSPLDAVVDMPDLRPAARLLAPAKEKFQKLARAPSHFDGGANPRYVYVDLDNIYVSFVKADHLASVFPGAASARDLQLDLQGLTRRFAEGSAGGAPARLVAFYFNTPESIAEKLRTLSFGGVAWEVRKQETTSDTSMQLELLISKHPCSAHPKTLVLVTGDGNVAPNGMCFREIMDKYLRDAWSVEVHAWVFSMAKTYIKFQREYSSVVLIRPLDDEKVGEVVRIRGKAKAKPSPGHTIPSSAGVSHPVKPATKPTKENSAGARTAKQAKHSPSKPAKAKKAAHDEPASEVAAVVPRDDDDEEKWAVIGEDEDEGYEEVFAQFDRHAFTVALMKAVEEVCSAPLPATRSTTRVAPPVTLASPVTTTPMRVIPPVVAAPTTTRVAAPVTLASPVNTAPVRATPPVVATPTTTASYTPEQFKRLIEQLEGPNGELFIPSAITMLANSDTRTDATDVSSIQEADVETQRLLLVMALEDEMDVATRLLLRAESVQA